MGARVEMLLYLSKSEVSKFCEIISWMYITYDVLIDLFCMCTCVWRAYIRFMRVHMLWAHMYMGVEARGWYQVTSYIGLPFFFKAESLPDSGSLGSLLAGGHTVSTFQALRLQTGCHTCPAIYITFGDLKSSHLHRKHLIHWAIL